MKSESSLPLNFCEEVPRGEAGTKADIMSAALAIARGCLDYGGGHRGDARELEIYHHGVQTVINALEGYAERGADDSQVAALLRAGRVT